MKFSFSRISWRGIVNYYSYIMQFNSRHFDTTEIWFRSRINSRDPEWDLSFYAKQESET